eukprot:COSAG01_NODE_12020_length_1815_cov_2.556527_3_plen_27_part_01
MDLSPPGAGGAGGVGGGAEEVGARRRQ